METSCHFIKDMAICTYSNYINFYQLIKDWQRYEFLFGGFKYDFRIGNSNMI